MTTWKMSRMNAHRPAFEKVDDTTIPARIEALLGNGLLNEWENSFLQSIKAGYEKYKSLTKGQYDAFVNVEKRYCTEAVNARKVWIASWDAEKSSKWKQMIEYYSTTPYFVGEVQKAKENPDYIPTESSYKKICENKYAEKYLTQLKIPAKFNVGQLVVCKQYGSHKLATVVSIGKVTGWAKGSREYTVFIAGNSRTEAVLEKQLTYYRESLNNKIILNEDEIPF